MRDASPAFRILLVLVLAGLAVVPLVAGTFYLQLLTKIMILAIFAMSLDLLVGFTGLVSTRPNGAGLPAAAHDPALAVRPGACRHPRQRAAHARARLPDLPLQACRRRDRRRGRRARWLPLRRNSALSTPRSSIGTGRAGCWSSSSSAGWGRCSARRSAPSCWCCCRTSFRV